MLKAIGAVVVLVLIVAGVVAAVVLALSPKLRDLARKELTAWKNRT